jgi:hypothetical protein
MPANREALERGEPVSDFMRALAARHNAANISCILDRRSASATEAREVAP